VVTAAGSACIREDQDAFLVVHERLRLGEIGCCCAVLDHEPVADVTGARLADDAARAASHLRDEIAPEILDDLVERARNRRQAGQLFDQCGAACNRLTTFDGLAVAEHRTRGQITL
jgi:hypothetical protein